MLREGRHGNAVPPPAPRPAGRPSPGPTPANPPPHGAPGGWPGDRHGPRPLAGHEHRRDELPPAQARIGRARRGGGRGGGGRGRWWGGATPSHGWTERDGAGDPDAEAASDWLRRHYLRSFLERYERWLDQSTDESLDWRDAAEFGDAELRLSPDGLRAFQAELAELLQRYRQPPPGAPAGRRVARD